MRWAVLVLVLAMSAGAHATIIDFQTELVAGQRFRTTYTVTNESASALQLFDIAFDTSLYDELSLTPVSGPAVTGEWSELILGSAPGAPALYDAFAFGAGVAPGETFGGFAVEFDWLGMLDDAFSARQAFFVYDAATFDLLETGTTRRAGAQPVSEPGPFALLLAGFALAVLRSRTERAVDPITMGWT